MRARALVSVLTGLVVGLCSAAPAVAQAPAPPAEIEMLKQELRRLQQRLDELERRQAAPAPPVPAPTPAPPPTAAQPVPPRAGETEIKLERETLLETIGLPKPEIGGVKISGFFIGSANWASGTQIVPEAFGSASSPSDPGRTNFRFDKFGLGVAKTFASWLSASAAIEVESHAHRHTHLITDGSRGCPRSTACERFGAEAPTTEVVLDRFDVTVVAPIGNGLRLSLGRFDVPFGIERHDENLLLTATTSEIFRFARPQKMTGFMASYAFGPSVDLSTWLVNRWENEDTGEEAFDDLNPGKSVGGRVGFTPFPGRTALNFGLGGWYGSEGGVTSARRLSRESHTRWLLDADVTWSPTSRLLFAGELVYGGEQGVRVLGRVGMPVAEDLERDKDVRWWGFYVLGHYDFVSWAGVTFRYSLLEDEDRGRTGVGQTLQSFTITPVLHLSALIPGLRPTGAVVPRTSHPYHWVDLKFEYRLGVSDRPIFGEAQADHSLHNRASDTGHQITIQAVVNF